MQKKLFLRCALIVSALLIAVPVWADDDEIEIESLTGITVGDVTAGGGGTGKIFAGVGINASADGSSSFAGWFKGNGTDVWQEVSTDAWDNDTFIIDGFTINFGTGVTPADDPGENRVAAILGQGVTTGTYNVLGNVSITGQVNVTNDGDDHGLAGVSIAGITTGNIFLKDVTVINGTSVNSQGALVGAGDADTIGVGIGTTVFSGKLSTGTITVYGGTGQHATGLGIWGGIDTTEMEDFNVGEIFVTASATNAGVDPAEKAFARGIAVDAGVNEAWFGVTKDIVVINSGNGEAQGVHLAGTTAHSHAVGVLEGVLIAAINEGTGDASAINVNATGGTVWVGGHLVAMADTGTAIGISMEAEESYVILTSDASILAYSEEGTAASVTFDAADSGLRIEEGENSSIFTNAGYEFGVQGANLVDFDVDADLVGGHYEGVKAFALGDGVVANLGKSDITIDDNLVVNTSVGGVFRTIGGVTVEENAAIGINGDGGRVDFLGGFVVENGKTAAISINDSEGDASNMLGLNVERVAVGTGATLTVDLTTDGVFEVYGEVLNAEIGIAGTNAEDRIFSVGSALSGWGVEDGKLARFNLKYANMNDAFLAAGMIHQRNTGYNMVRDRFISAQRRAGNGYRGQAFCDPCEAVQSLPDPCDPCGTGFSGLGSRNGGARSAWVNYIGRGDEFGAWDLGSNGVQVGSDLFRSNRSQFGVIFGYEDGWAKANSHYSSNPPAGLVDRVDSEDTYFGFYAARVFRNGFDGRFVYNQGWQEFDSVRYQGGDTFTSSYKGRTSEINLELGKRFYDGAWSFRPFGGLDIYNVRLNSATELNATSEVPYNAYYYSKLDKTQVFLRTGLDLRYVRNRLTFNSGISYAYDVNGAKFERRVAVADMNFRGTHFSTLRGAKMGEQLLTVNVGGEYQLGRNLSVFGGYNGQAVVDRTGGFQNAGYVGGAVKW